MLKQKRLKQMIELGYYKLQEKCIAWRQGQNALQKQTKANSFRKTATEKKELIESLENASDNLEKELKLL